MIEPVVACRILDAPVEWPRWTWTQIYSDGSPDAVHCAVQMFSGGLVRARQVAGGVDVQQIADPNNAAQWAAWTALKAAGTTQAGGGLALASSTTEDRLRLFYVDSADGRTIRCAESTDGATWLETLVITEGAGTAVKNLAADMTAGDNHLVYLLDLGGAAPSQVMVAIELVAGAWVNRVQHAQTRYTTRGLSANRDPAAGFIYCGVADGDATGARRVAFQEFNTAAHAWAGGSVLIEAPAGSAYDYLQPRLRLADAAFPRHVYTFVEQYGGGVPFNRPTIAVTPQRYVLTETVPWDVDSPYGFVLLRNSTAWYLIAANRSYRSSLESGQAGQFVDASADLWNFEAVENVNAPGRLTVRLDNRNSQYANAGQPGNKLAVREGSQVSLGLGFRTSLGDEYLWQSPWWIDRVGYEDELGNGYIRLDCIDAWEYLERLRAPRQLVFPVSSSVGSVLDRILWRVTGGSVGAAGALATAVPYFTIPAGQSYAHAVRRLCRLAGVIVRFSTNQAAADGLGLSSVVPSAQVFASGASAYAYAAADVATTQHPVRRARYASGGQPFTHVEVFGASGLVGESIDHTAIRRIWKNVPRKLIDKAADTQAKVDAVAAAELLAAQAGLSDGWIDTQANVALEVGDVIDVTDPRVPLAAAKRTVVSIKTVLDRRRKLAFDQRIAIAGAT